MIQSQDDHFRVLREKTSKAPNSETVFRLISSRPMFEARLLQAMVQF